jgi:N-acetyl-1-D-myo-inositol-2-amino-2-deoxy-alpha-D-glucopyranoside deacetylase
VSGDVLAVFAHPDDESLLAGGVLAACAARGSRVVVVSLTRGERGPSATTPPGDRASLADAREAELAAAADALGAAQAECLSYPDGELQDAEEHAVEALAALFERERPEAVIGFSPEGLYWHPDHVASAAFVAKALNLHGASVCSYGATWPAGHARRLASRMRSRGLSGDLWGIDPDAFGAPGDAITTSIDVRAFLPAKLAALYSHHSQLEPKHLLRALPPDLAEEFLGREYFVRLAPEKTDQDWLAGTLPGLLRR